MHDWLEPITIDGGLYDEKKKVDENSILFN
jgi:hypothetical protein